MRGVTTTTVLASAQIQLRWGCKEDMSVNLLNGALRLQVGELLCPEDRSEAALGDGRPTYHIGHRQDMLLYIGREA